MDGVDVTRERLAGELDEIRRRIANLEALEAERRSADDALQESEDLSRGLLEAATVGTYIVQDGRFRYVNPQFEEITGYAKYDLLGTYSLTYVHPDDRDLVRSRAIDGLKGRSRLSYEFRFVHKDGRPLWILERVASVQYRGRPAALGSFMDITERKRAEEELRESEELSRGLLEAATVGMYIVQDGKFRYANPQFEQITGYSRDELLGTYSLDYVHPEDRELVRNRAIDDLKGQSSLSYEFRFVHKDGRPLWILERVASIQYKGRPAAVGSFMDVTERKTADEALRSSEERYRLLAENATDFIWAMDTQLRFFYVSPSVTALLGYSVEEAVALTIDDLIEPDDAEAAVKALAEEPDGGEGAEPSNARTLEVQLRRKDGSRVWVESKMKYIRDESGEPVGVAGVSREIAQRKRAQEELLESERKLRHLFESVTDGIAAFDGNLFVTEVNQEWLDMHRCESKADVLGKSGLSFVAHRDLEKAQADMRTIVERGSLVRQEYTALRSDGTEFPAEMSGRVLTDSAGDVTGLIIVVRDITERKQAEERVSQSEHKYRTALESARDGILILDAVGCVVDVNETCMTSLGCDSKEQLVGKNALELLAPGTPEEMPPGLWDSLGKTLREGKGYVTDLELVARSLDGRQIPVEVNISLLANGDDAESGAVVVVRDITGRKRAQKETQRHSQRLEALHAITVAVSQSVDLNQMLDSALDTVLAVVEADGGYIHLLDRAKKELVLKAHRGVPEEYVEAIDRMGVRDEALERWQEYPEPAFSVDGIITEDANAVVTAAERDQRFELFLGVPLWSKSGMHGGLTLVGRKRRRFSAEELDLLKAIGNEIAVGIENVRLLEKTRELSVTDELTELKNRRNFYEVLDSEMERTQRYGLSFSLVMLDLDGFKEYNDRYGHTNGDAVLKSLGRRLGSSLRKSDTAFRYGGDEFSIILPATDAAKSKKMVDRFRAEWLESTKSDGAMMESRLAFSAGIAQFPENAETSDGLVFLADTALYRSKREGGHKSTLVSDLGTLASGSVDRETLDHVYALAATVDARDPYTYGHSKRVAAIAEMVGRAARLSPNDLAHLRGAALLHDIGKVGVPDSTLGKPSKLTKAEWEVIRKHCDEGARIVSHVKALEALVPLIRHHHEWYDGTGYPGGLEGERIPMGARIIAIADAFDTMTTRRPYREPVSKEEAFAELRRCSGTQFDAVLVGLFGEALRGAVWEGGLKLKRKKAPSMVRR